MAIPTDLALTIWYQALDAEFGISVETTDWHHFQRCLYEARMESGDPELWTIRMVALVAGHPNEVWFVKKSVSV